MPFTSPFAINKVECPNFQAGRDNLAPTAFVIHKPEGYLDSVVPYLIDPETKKSYHFIIARNGDVVQLVETVDTAWHAGVVVNPSWKSLRQGINPNLYTIGIACEGFAAVPISSLQFTSLCYLVAALSKDYNIPLTEETVVFHREIRSDKTCPGGFINKVALITNAQNVITQDGIEVPSPTGMVDINLCCE